MLIGSFAARDVATDVPVLLLNQPNILRCTSWTSREVLPDVLLHFRAITVLCIFDHLCSIPNKYECKCVQL